MRIYYNKNILPAKYPGLDELNLSEFTLHLRACLSSAFVTGFTSPSFATIAKSVLRTKIYVKYNCVNHIEL